MKSETGSAEAQMDSSSSSSSSCCKRKAVESLISDSGEKRERLELSSQVTACTHIHSESLTQSHSLRLTHCAALDEVSVLIRVHSLSVCVSVDQDVLSVKDVCDLIHYITLRRLHSVRKPRYTHTHTLSLSLTVR